MTSGYRGTIVEHHEATSGDGQNPSTDYFFIRTLRNGSGYYLTRSWLGFDISSLISQGAVIDSAYITLFRNDTVSFADSSNLGVVLVPFDSTQNNPAYTTEFNQWFSTGYAFYGAISDVKDITSWVSNGSGENLNLNSFGLSYLTNGTNGGFIRFGVVTDVDEVAGTIPLNDDNIIGFSSGDNANSAVRPILVVNYHLSGGNDQPNATNTPLATSSLVTPFTYLNSTTTASITGGCDTFDFGCYIINGLAYLFVPSSDSLSQFRALTLASSSPFSYAYDMQNIYNELFTTSTTSVLAFSLPFAFYGNGSSTITLISHDMITDEDNVVLVSVVTMVRNLLVILLWFGFIQFAYRQILQVHNKEHHA